jgi:hypothetical protein
VSHHAHTNQLLLLLLLLIQQNLMIQPEALITVNIGTFNTATQPHLLLRMLPPLQSPSQAPIPDQPPPLASHHAHKKPVAAAAAAAAADDDDDDDDSTEPHDPA